MCIILNEIRSYSKEIVNFIQSHQDAYTGLEHLWEGVDVPKDRQLFNILKDNQIVGFFMVVNNINKGKDIGCEIEIGIFDNYAEKGLAQKTIKYFLEEYIDDEFKINNTCVYATIQKGNNCINIMRKILNESNFILIEEPVFAYKESEEGIALLKRCGMALPTDTETKELIYYYKL